MTVDTETVNTTTLLAQRDTIRAVRSGRYVVIVVRGQLPTAGYEVHIEPSPLRIFPQQYNLVLCPLPGIWPQVVVPYHYRQVIVVPVDQSTVTIHHADGEDAVEIEEAGGELAGFTAAVSEDHSKGVTTQATGMSPNLSFDEAFADAVKNLPPSPRPTHPEDQLIHIEVHETGALFGGIAGFHHLYVKIRSNIT